MGAIELTGPDQSVSIVTSTADQIDYVASWVDVTPGPNGSAQYDEGSSHGAIAAIGTTADAVPAPSTGQRRRIVAMSAYNAGAGPNLVQIQKAVAGAAYVIWRAPLDAGERVELA